LELDSTCTVTTTRWFCGTLTPDPTVTTPLVPEDADDAVPIVPT